jgi:hypothetical protein
MQNDQNLLVALWNSLSTSGKLLLIESALKIRLEDLAHFGVDQPKSSNPGGLDTRQQSPLVYGSGDSLSSNPLTSWPLAYGT